MVITPLQLLIGKAAGTAAVILLALTMTYHSGYKHGHTKVLKQWAAEQKVRNDALLVLTGKIHQQELANRQESTRIAEQLRKSEVQHEEAVAALNAERAQRLRLSAERASGYQRLAEAGPAERRGLASHAAELDRSLEEGRSLVGELAAALGQREQQLKLLGAQITEDRKLLGEAP